MPRLTLCLIARDEEQMLPGCLASVAGVVDEVVLVDTGSTDRTVDIARAAGATVLVRPWDDDFSAPRNLGIEHAHGDWVLVLDADERLAPGAGNGLFQAMRRDFDVGFLRLHNALRADAPPAAVLAGAERLGESAQLPRLLRNAGGLRYTGVVHETVRDWMRARGNRTHQVDADIIHLGNLEAVRKARNKLTRNMQLLRKRVAAEPDDPTAHGYLALELRTAGLLDEAWEVAEAGWRLVPAQPPTLPLLRLAVARGLLAHSAGLTTTAVETADLVLRRDGPHPDLLLLRGAGREALGLRPGASAAERAQLLAGAVEDYRLALHLLARGGLEQVFFAEPAELQARLGHTLAASGKHAEARRAFETALDSGLTEVGALGLAWCEVAAGNPAGALRRVEPVLGTRPDGWVVASLAASALGAGDDAQQFLGQARARASRGFALGFLRASLA